MRATFHTASLTLILRNVQLERFEKEIIETLLGAAHAGIYWDTLSRQIAREEMDVVMVLKNICIKIYMAGLVPTIKALKEQFNAEDTELRCDVPDGTAAA